MKRIHFTFLLAITLVGCSKNNNSTPSTTEIWPLKLNNEWTFTFTVYKEDGSIRETEKNTVAVTGDTLINGYSCFKNEEVYEDCVGGIRVKIVKYFAPGVGLVLTENYSNKSGSNILYLMTKEILENYKLN